RGEAQMYNHLGQVALALGQREEGAGRLPSARKHWADAAGWLDASIRSAQDRGWAVAEGFARKDRALLDLAQGDIEGAERQAQEADRLFREARFAEGVAHVERARGIALRRQGRFDDAGRALRAALAHFEESGERAEVVRTLWELARARRDAEAPRPLVAQ